MKISTNTKLIKRNARIGQILMWSGMGVLVVGLYLNLKNDPAYYLYVLLSLPVGFILSQIGLTFNNRWGRQPRQEEKINESLKGLDNKYSLYHYLTPVDHLLVGPAGVWILIPFRQGGKVSYQGKRWNQQGVNLFSRIFMQESLGRPDLEIAAQQQDLDKYLAKKLPENDTVAVQTALVFLNPKVVLETSDAPFPAIPLEKLKDFIRRRAKENPLPLEKAAQLVEIFPPAE